MQIFLSRSSFSDLPEFTVPRLLELIHWLEDDPNAPLTMNLWLHLAKIVGIMKLDITHIMSRFLNAIGIEFTHARWWNLKWIVEEFQANSFGTDYNIHRSILCKNVAAVPYQRYEELLKKYGVPKPPAEHSMDTFAKLDARYIAENLTAAAAKAANPPELKKDEPKKVKPQNTKEEEVVILDRDEANKKVLVKGCTGRYTRDEIAGYKAQGYIVFAEDPFTRPRQRKTTVTWADSWISTDYIDFE
jgi:hypothetical protein